MGYRGRGILGGKGTAAVFVPEEGGKFNNAACNLKLSLGQNRTRFLHYR